MDYIYRGGDGSAPGTISAMYPTVRTSRIGRHLPTSGGLSKTLSRAEALGLEALQIFVSNPQGWAEPVRRPDAEEFASGARRLGLSPVVAHAKYLINLASPDAALRERSVRALAHELAAAGELGVELIVVHCGSHGGDGRKRGMEGLAEGLDLARKEARELCERPSRPVIENSVGAGTQLCSSLEDLAEAAACAGVGACVDTAHAFAAGYDLSSGAGEFTGEVRKLLGSSLALLHLNDAANPCGSRRDGHRRIGEGRVPAGSWRELFAGLPGVPAVMETPYATPEVDAEQVRLVKRLAGGCQRHRNEDRIRP